MCISTNFVALPPSQFQDVAEELLGRRLTDDEIQSVYIRIESSMNDALDQVLRQGIKFEFPHEIIV